MNNKCHYFENLFVDYINETLPEKDSTFCKEHLATCNNCKTNQVFSEMLTNWKVLDKWNDVQPSKNFMAKIQYEIALLEEKRKIFWFSLDKFFTFARVPIMSLLLILFTLSNNFVEANNKTTYLKNNGEVIQEHAKKISELKINDLLMQLNTIYRTGETK